MNDIDKARAKAATTASAKAVSSEAKTYTTAADRKNQISNSVAQKTTVSTPKQETEPLVSYAQQAKNNIGNSIAKKVTTPASEKQEINYSVSPAQALKNQVANSALNVQKTAEKAAIDKQISERDKNFFPEQYEVFMTPAQQRKQQISDQIAENYNKGENWLMTDDGTDYFAKGFVNRLRSTGGKAVEDLAYLINDLAPSYKPATDVIEKNEAGQIGETATQQMAQAQENADTWLGKQLVMAGDSTATMLGYMLLPGGKEHLAAYMGTGGGLDEYRQRREDGASELEAATRGITKGAISYLVESMGGIGAGVGQKIPGVSTIGKKLDELATKNFFTSVLSNALDEGGEELVEYVADYIADCLADKMFKGEIQTDFDISEMLQNALTGAIVGGGFGVVKGATPQIDSAAKDIVEAVKNEKIQENAQAQQEAIAEAATEQAANIPAEAKTEQEAAFASPTAKTFEQRAEELYRQGNSWGEIGKILQAEYHPDWKVDNVKKEARNYIRKSDFYGEKGIPKPEEKTIDNGKGEEYNQGESGYAIIAPYFDRQVSGSEDVAKAQAEAENEFLGRAEQVANQSGTKILGVSKNIGGYTFDENTGERVTEISYSFEINGTEEARQVFSSLMGDIGYEAQDSVVSGRYVENIDEANAMEFDIHYKGLSAFDIINEILTPNGVFDYTIDETNKIIRILDFDPQNPTTGQAIADTIEAKLGGFFNGTDYQPTQSKLLYAGDRADVYRKGLEKSEQTGGDGLRDYYLSAQSANEALRNRQRQINKQAENEAGAESPGFSNGQNSVDYRNLQNITDTFYRSPDTKNEDIYAPFYLKDNRPEGNTVGAKQSIEGTYANAQNKYDVFPEGENAARVIDVPQKMNDETNVTRFARTEMEAKVTPDSLIPVFKKAVEQGDFSYNKVTDKSAVDYAAKQISNNGYEKSIGEFTSKVDGSKILTKNDLVIGEMLYAQAANAGDVKSAMELASALAHEFTKAGQAVQAARILKKLSPEGRLYNAQKIADRLFEKGTSKSEIKIDEKLAQDLLNAKTDADIEAAEDAIKNNIAEQIEKTPGQKLADKWNAWRYLSMLGNPKTHIRNFLGNAAFYPVRKMKNAVKSVLEAGTKEKTATLKRATKEQKAFAKESYDRNAKMLMSGGSYRFESDIESREQIFKSKILEAIRKANGNALEAEDAFFLKNAYIDSLSQYLRANNIDPANITPEQQTKAENYAQKEAWKATYRDASKVASALEKFSRTNKATKLFMEAFIPFRKTPINVLSRGIEYSPVGLVKGIVDISANVKSGKVDASTAIDELASGLTGTGIAALGYWLASMGLLSGGDDENDKVQNFAELQGKKNYALDIGEIADYFGFNIGDINYTIDWAAPTSLPLFVGVEFYNALETGEFDTDDAGRLFSATLDTITKTADPMIGLSMLQNLETVISGNYDGNAFSGLIGEAVVGYILQAFPTLGSQIAQTIDGTRRNAYFKDPNSSIPEEFQIPLNRIMQKIPGLSQKLPERVDEWGRTEKQSDNIAIRVFENFVSPGYIGRGNTTEVDKYLNQLYVKTGDNSILPSNMAKNFSVDGEKTNLSAKQYAEAQKVKGQTAYNLVEDVMSNSVFKGLSAEEQASVISSIYQYSTAIAKSKVSNYEPTDWIAKASEAEKQGLEIDDYITLHKVKNNLKTTDEKSVPEQFLDQLYVTKISDEAKVAALEYIGGVNVDKYRSAVSDPKDILALYDITSFKDAKNGQEEKDVDLEQIKKQFGTNIYDSREIYYKANDRWYNDYDEAIAGGDNRDKKAPIFTKFNFSEAEVTKGYNAVIGLNSKDDMLDALTYAFGSSKKATTFYNILKGKKGYK